MKARPFVFLDTHSTSGLSRLNFRGELNDHDLLHRQGPFCISKIIIPTHCFDKKSGGDQTFVLTRN